ncbi:hypothetical protein BDB01DRAFT_846491 [Pilobolus umbonatus]|nr:hypothetical protein BDB01DRAFT_846491 [Pilobolus umbonatus]
MAFAQQQRRPTPRYHDPIVTEEFLSSNEATNVISDSDNDWHVINTITTSSSSSTHSSRSPVFMASESESLSSFRPSDNDSYSDLDPIINQLPNYNTIPSHDGTGTFVDEGAFIDDLNTQDISDSNASYDRVAQQLFIDSNEEEEANEHPDHWNRRHNNENSINNILLPYAGLQPPSFLKQNEMNDIPEFVPTVRLRQALGSSERLSADETVLQNTVVSDGGTSCSLDDNIKFTSKTQRNLDSIPVHHPGFLGSSTSSAILSVVWNSVRRLTNHIIENETNTAETLSTIMSEAVFEGCLPFGSHLHMDIGAGIRTSYHSSLLEGEYT